MKIGTKELLRSKRGKRRWLRRRLQAETTALNVDGGTDEDHDRWWPDGWLECERCSTRYQTRVTHSVHFHDND